MKIIFLLILVSLVVALGFLAAFFWAVKSGQYEDDYTPSMRILFDNETSTPASSEPQSVQVELQQEGILKPT